ncbi:MAG: ATP-binding protein, partial [Gammaproteobacteria bacterium]|nr:ATP-binding protein [Gammaproteobacteria bacterium]
MRRIKILSPIVLTSLITSLAVVLLILLDTNEQETRFNETKRALSIINEANARIDEVILRLRFGLLKDYDELVKINTIIQADIKKMRALQSEKTLFFFELEQPFFQKLETSVTHKYSLIQDFKAEHAILKNSIAFFPTAIKNVQKSLSGTDNEFVITRTLLALEKSILEYVLAGDQLKRTEIAEIKRRIETEPLFAGMRESGAWLIARKHMNMVLMYKKTIDELVNRIVNIPLPRRVGDALAMAERIHRQNSVLINVTRAVLFLIIIGTIGFGLWRALNLRREAEQTRAQNETLEKHVRERTSELATAMQRTRLLLESAGEGIYGVDPEGVPVFINPAASKMLGHPVDELRSCPIFETILQNPSGKSSCQREQHPIFITLNDGEIRHISEETFWREDGSSFPAEYRVHPMLQNESIVGAVITFNDISDRKRSEAEMQRLNREVMDAHRAAGMAEIATGVLHNVGNVLNSLNVSASTVAEKVRNLKLSSLKKLHEMFEAHSENMPEFLEKDPKGQKVPEFLGTLSTRLCEEQQLILDEFRSMSGNLDHIKDIVSKQQTYAKAGGVLEPVELPELVDDALKLHLSDHHHIDVIREFTETPSVMTEKHKVLQILTNLIANAKQALGKNEDRNRKMTLRIQKHDPENINIQVSDNGIGITKENLDSVFTYGFTTKRDGHGFGLHASALAAKEMGGSLSCHSDGPGQGAT